MKLILKTRDKFSESFPCAVNITNTSFKGNYARLKSGGHMYLQAETRITGKQLLEISSCVFTDGHAQVAGGAMKIYTPDFIGNVSSLRQSVLLIKMSQLTFYNNSGST